MTISPPQTHPLEGCLGRIAAELDEVGQVALWATTRPQRVAAIAAVHRLEARLAGLRLGLVAQADIDNDAADEGAVNTAALVRALTMVPGPVAVQTVKLARALSAHPITQDALSLGDIDVARAREVTAAVDALPSAVGAADRDRAETHLVGLATRHDAVELKRLGGHLVDVVDPDGAEARLGKKVASDERKAARKTYLEMRKNTDGGWDGRFAISGLAGDKLQRLLHAFTNPDRPDRPDGGIPFEDPSGTKRPTPERLGEAFEQLIARYPLDKAPKLRGRNATVVVTMSLESLMGGSAPAQVDTGRLISASAARCLAADAGIIPAVLGGDGAVLDLGPHVRFFTPWQRVAMAVQQGGLCAVEGCDRPVWWCDGAHIVPWIEDGPTSVENGALVCPRHHQMADSPKYQIEKLRPGRLRLVRRQ